MKVQKQRVSLLEFLRSGYFGSFLPRRDCSPEDIIAIFGKPGRIEVCAPGKEGEPYEEGRAECFPVVVSYGHIEFHFDSPSTLFALYADTFFSGCPVGGRLKLTDTALLRHGRAMDDFMVLAKARGLSIQSVEPYAEPYAWLVDTGNGIRLHFEHDDPAAPGSKATLRAFYWSVPRFTDATHKRSP